MTVNLTQKELSYIVKHFGYKQLEGFDPVKFNKKECESSLEDRGYIKPYGKSFELSNDMRLVLSAWMKSRYTLVKHSCLLENHIFAIFASNEYIFSYSMHEGDVRIDLCDFNFEAMDKIIADYLDITDDVNSLSNFNVSFTAEEFISLFENELPNEVISGKIGLSAENVQIIKNAIAEENNTTFILQDVIDDIGCMGIITKNDDGYVMIKHIVPNRIVEHQKAVVVKGNAKDIVDSVYIL